MRVEIRLFAAQRVQLGRSRLALDLPEGADVGSAWQALVAAYPQLSSATSSVRFARNRRYVDADEPLAEGDELAVIPPVAGGAAEDPSARDDAGRERAAGDVGRQVHLALTADLLSDGLLASLRQAVVTPADGAVAVFLGVARETPGTPAPGEESEAARFAGERVVGLTYEAFEPMALAVLEQVADEIQARFGVRRLAIVHRVGEVGIGEASVAIVVAAPHREEAFAACRYAIEELKSRAPIWKSERFADGRVWLGAPARHGPAPGGPSGGEDGGSTSAP